MTDPTRPQDAQTQDRGVSSACLDPSKDFWDANDDDTPVVFQGRTPLERHDSGDSETPPWGGAGGAVPADPPEGADADPVAEPQDPDPGQEPDPDQRQPVAEGTLIDELVKRWEKRERNARRIRRCLRPDDDPHFGHENLFRLVWEVRAGGKGDEVSLRGPLEAACRRLGADWDAVWAKAMAKWDSVRYGREKDVMALAQRLADEVRPAPLPDNITRRFPDKVRQLERLASCAYWLDQAAKGKKKRKDWAVFPSERLAVWLGVHRETVDGWIIALENAKVIRVKRNEDGKTVFCFDAGRARSVRYIGLPPPR